MASVKIDLSFVITMSKEARKKQLMIFYKQVANVNPNFRGLRSSAKKTRAAVIPFANQAATDLYIKGNESATVVNDSYFYHVRMINQTSWLQLKLGSYNRFLTEVVAQVRWIGCDTEIVSFMKTFPWEECYKRSSNGLQQNSNGLHC